MNKGRCSSCGKTRDRRTCPGHSQGNYRRAGRHITRFVCEECCRDRLAYVLTPGSNAHLNENAFEWEYALRAFGIDIPSGTPLTRMTGRVQP